MQTIVAIEHACQVMLVLAVLAVVLLAWRILRAGRSGDPHSLAATLRGLAPVTFLWSGILLMALSGYFMLFASGDRSVLVQVFSGLMTTGVALMASSFGLKFGRRARS